MEMLPSMTYSQKSHEWKCFQARCHYRKVADGNASKRDMITEKGQGAEMGLGVP